MTERSVNGDGSGGRSGTRALLLLATPINAAILKALAEESKPLVDLRRKCGSPAQTTVRAHLKELEEAGAIVRHRRNRFPGVIVCELTKAGQDLVEVSLAVENWLQVAPEGPLRLGTNPAKAAIRALVDGWSSSMLRVLAARPLSLTELDGIIDSVSYPTLQRRLAAMRLAGQLEPCPDLGRGTHPYRITRWLREGVGPLTVATQWERRHLPNDTPAVTPIDTETGFLLALPLLRLPGELKGACRLGVEIAGGRERRLAGAIAQVEDGRVAACTVRLNQSADAWAIGPVGAWFRAVTDGDTASLELGGDQQLARALLEALADALFPRRIATAP